MKCHSGQTFKCEECPEKWISGPENIFCSKKKLENHKFQCHKTKLECQTCGKSYTRSSHFKRHLETHGEKIKCEKCETLFANKDNLSVHKKACLMKLPSEGRLFECNVCTGTFSSQSNLNAYNL